MESSTTADEWQSLVRAAGLRLVESTWPQQVHCPFCCDGIVKIYDGETAGSKHFYSTCCGLRSDLPEFLARVRDEPTQQSVRWLAKLAPKLHAIYSASPTDAQLHVRNARELLNKTWEIAIPPSKAHISTAFSRIMKSHGVGFQPILDWHRKNLDEQFRLITPELIKSVFAAHKHMLNQPVGIKLASIRSEYLVARLMTVPWQLAGLQFFGADSNDQVQLFCDLPDTPAADIAYMCHPRILIENSPLIITSDKVAAFRASFVNGQESPLPSPFAAIVSDREVQSVALQSLLGRPILLWCDRLSPTIIRIASQTSARLTRHGYENGSVSLFQMRRLAGSNAYEVLVAKSVPWQIPVVANARNSTPKDIARFLRAALDNIETIEAFLERWLPELKTTVMCKMPA